MFAYPEQAVFNRALPKNLIYKNAKPSKAVKGRFVSQVSEIVWKYKLSQDTLNLAPRDGFTEIQVFDITLKVPDLNFDVLTVIDKAIPYPIFFRLHFEGRVNRVATYKRPSGAQIDTWVMSDIYFETGRQDAAAQQAPLPVALDIKSLYEQMLIPYIGCSARANESVGALVERVQQIRKKKRELDMLEKKIIREKQFNRKVELNTQIRELNKELAFLTE